MLFSSGLYLICSDLLRKLMLHTKSVSRRKGIKKEYYFFIENSRYFIFFVIKALRYNFPLIINLLPLRVIEYDFKG